MTPLSNRPVHLTRRLFVVGYVVPMALVAVGFAIGYAKLEDAISKNETARVALCAQQADVDRRSRREARKINRTERILAEAHGPTVFGIPRQLILDGLRDDKADHAATQQTQHNLSVLNCKE